MFKKNQKSREFLVHAIAYFVQRMRKIDLLHEVDAFFALVRKVAPYAVTVAVLHRAFTSDLAKKMYGKLVNVYNASPPDQQRFAITFCLQFVGGLLLFALVSVGIYSALRGLAIRSFTKRFSLDDAEQTIRLLDVLQVVFIFGGIVCMFATTDTLGNHSLSSFFLALMMLVILGSSITNACKQHALLLVEKRRAR